MSISIKIICRLLQQEQLAVLKTKWGIIKHVICKFQGVHLLMKDLNESSMSEEDIIQKMSELY